MRQKITGSANRYKTIMDKSDDPPPAVRGTAPDDEIEFRDPTTPVVPTSSLEERMTNMEQILGKISDSLMGSTTTERKSRTRHRSSSYSSVESEDQSSIRTLPHRRSPSKSINPLAYETLFPDEDIKISNFDGVMLALFKTIEVFIDEDQDLTWLVRHDRYLAEKSVADVYIPETFVNFDRHIRTLAFCKGYETFEGVSDLDKARFFNLENYREVRALKSKSKQNKKSNNTCRHYNGEAGCYAKSCNYVHRCSHCETYGHALKDCKSARADNIQK